MLRRILLLAALLLPVLAHAATYTLNVTPAAVAGSPTGTTCQVFINGTASGTGATCGTVQNLSIPGVGSYAVTYRTVASGVQSANASPATNVTITAGPPNPIVAPSVTVTCTPAPCDVIVTVN